MLTPYEDQKTHCSKPVVGLAGGIGSGKSTVAKILSELGAGVIESDRLSHQEINADDVKEALCRWWGEDVLRADGTVDRRRIGSIVFADPTQRHRLESLLHPRIAVRRRVLMEEFERQPRIRMIVLDSPLLYESDLDLICDVVVFVDTTLDCREARSEKSRNWKEGETARREKLQLGLDIKRTRADYVCNNNSSLADLRKQVERMFAQIVSGSSAT